MKTLIWKDEQAEISSVGLVSKGSIFDIDDKRAESFINQGKAQLHDAEESNNSVATKTVKKEK